VNFFFGINSSIFNSQLTIPRFQNSKPSNSNYHLYKIQILNNKWEINEQTNVKSSKDFYWVDNNEMENGIIFFLAKKNEIQKIEKYNFKKLINLNSYTDTTPAYRANLKISLNNGGFSSYQSEYPFSMITKMGGILSPLSTLLNKEADKNIIFFKNIYFLPKKEEFNAYFIDIKTKKVLKKTKIFSNFLNEIIIEKNLIKPEIFLFTDNYIGVPIFCSIKNKHISFEHTHPPHSYIFSDDKFKVINSLKKEFSEIIS